jgi:hypothetical protein
LIAVREGYAKAAAAAGVKTLFCGGFGRRFFYLYRLFRFFGAIKTGTPGPIRHRKNAADLRFSLQTTGHATCHHCWVHRIDVLTTTNK